MTRFPPPVSPRERCPDPGCRGYEGRHQPLCPLASDEWRARNFVRIVRRYRERLEQLQKAADYQRRMTAFWQGKYAIVKHENNQLRRQQQAGRQRRKGDKTDE